MKNHVLLASVDGLAALSGTKLKGATGFIVAHNLKQVQEHLKGVEEARAKIVEAHTVKEGGQPKPVMDKDGKVVQGQVHLERVDEFRKEMQELLDLEVGDLIKIKKLPVSALDNAEIEPRHLAVLDWLFEA
jgi:hypothetical protein